MIHQRVEIRAVENALGPIREAAERLDWPNGPEEQGPLGHEMEGEDPAAIAEVVHRNREALVLLEEGLERSRLQLSSDPNEEMSHILAWNRLAQLLLLRARSNWQEGNRSEALDDTFRVLRLGQLLEESQGGMSFHLVGSAFRAMGLRQLQAWLATKEAPLMELKPLVVRLEVLRPSAKGFRELCQVEYSQFASVLDEQEQVIAEAPGSFRKDIGLGESLINFPLVGRYFFQKNATKKLYADGFRELASSWEKPCSEIDLSEIETSVPRPVWAPNLAGRIIYTMGASSYRHLLVNKCRLQTELSATQLLITLRAYQADHGELPTTVGLLLTDYLSATPLDDFNGQPLRYLPELKLVYSVGENRVDDGGHEKKDWVFRIAF